MMLSGQPVESWDEARDWAWEPLASRGTWLRVGAAVELDPIKESRAGQGESLGGRADRAGGTGALQEAPSFAYS